MYHLRGAEVKWSGREAINTISSIDIAIALMKLLFYDNIWIVYGDRFRQGENLDEGGMK
jgi:hypothetical protein